MTRSEVHFQVCCPLSGSVSVGLTDYAHPDILGVWYKSINFAVKKARSRQIGATQSAKNRARGSEPFLERALGEVGDRRAQSPQPVLEDSLLPLDLVEALGFRVWVLGFGVWGLGFGVLVLGLRV